MESELRGALRIAQPAAWRVWMALEYARTHAEAEMVPVHPDAMENPTSGHTSDSDGLHRPLTVGQKARWVLGDMVGRSAAMERLFLQMRYLARHLRIALIEGEGGTGKRLAVQTLHGLCLVDGSTRRQDNQALVMARASTFLGEKDLRERLAQMQGGLLYLSHVDQLNAEEQVRLKQVAGWLQRQGLHARERATPLPATFPNLSPVQSDSPRAVPRALIAGSQRDLKSLVQRGTFRNDLYQQLASVRLLLPALRERAEDIPMLVQLFLEQRAQDRGALARSCTQEALLDLLGYRWPGNLTELRAVIGEALDRESAGASAKQAPAEAPLQAADFRLVLRAADPSTKEWMQQPNFEGAEGAEGVASMTSQPRHKEGVLPRSEVEIRANRRLRQDRPGQAHNQALWHAAARASSVVAWPTDGCGGAEGLRRDVDAPEAAPEAASGDRPSNALAGGAARARQPSSLQQQLREQPTGASMPRFVAANTANAALRPSEPACRGRDLSAFDQRDRIRAERAFVAPELIVNLNLDLAILAHIHMVLCHAGGNKLRAARLLGISRSTLYRLLEEKPAARAVHKV